MTAVPPPTEAEAVAAAERMLLVHGRGKCECDGDWSCAIVARALLAAVRDAATAREQIAAALALCTAKRRPESGRDLADLIRRALSSPPVPPTPAEPEAASQSRCTCVRCERKERVAGHCFDIDGGLWHDCAANGPPAALPAPKPPLFTCLAPAGCDWKGYSEDEADRHEHLHVTHLPILERDLSPAPEPLPTDQCVYAPCDMPVENGSPYCTLHGVKWGRGPLPTDQETPDA